jgi:hypothetical protein
LVLIMKYSRSPRLFGKRRCMIESLMPKTWRNFQTGVLCGIILMAAAVWIWRETRSPEDQAAYDVCLASGQTIGACEAALRVLHRQQGQALEAFEKAIKEEVAKRLASGASKREVVQWAKQSGFVSKALSDAAGISLKDIEDDNY